MTRKAMRRSADDCCAPCCETTLVDGMGTVQGPPPQLVLTVGDVPESWN